MESKKQVANKRILNSTSGWVVPFSSDSKKRAKEYVMTQINIHGAAVRLQPEAISSRVPMVWYRAAAIAVLIAAIPLLVHLIGNVSITNDTLGIAKHTLPDGSEVLLAPEANLQLNKAFWIFQRNISLIGDAYFEVKSGSTFEVHCENGSVSVLGTKFTVCSSGELLLVHCSEGSVRIDSKFGSEKIGAGQFSRSEESTLRIGNYEHEGHMLPVREFSFAEAPVILVASQLEMLLNKKVHLKIDQKLTYTGTFNASNPGLCLEIFCKAFGARYAENSSGAIEISY